MSIGYPVLWHCTVWQFLLCIIINVRYNVRHIYINYVFTVTVLVWSCSFFFSINIQRFTLEFNISYLSTYYIKMQLNQHTVKKSCTNWRRLYYNTPPTSYLEQCSHGVYFTERRLSISQLYCCDAQRPHVTSHIITIVQLLLARYHL